MTMMPSPSPPPPAPPGVATVRTPAVHLDIQREVAAMLAGVGAGRTMAVLTVRTGRGINLAVAHKWNHQWSTELWVGKSGWDQPVAGGVAVAFSR